MPQALPFDHINAQTSDHNYCETIQEHVLVGELPTAKRTPSPWFKGHVYNDPTLILLKQSKSKKERESFVILKAGLSAVRQVRQFLCSSSFSPPNSKVSKLETGVIHQHHNQRFFFPPKTTHV